MLYTHIIIYRLVLLPMRYIYIGFCGESEQEHADTVSLMGEVGFDQAFMFAYSLREKTHAAHTMVS